jgi:preprotein translocase subunit SecG
LLVWLFRSRRKNGAGRVERLYKWPTAHHIPALMWLSIAIPILLTILVIVCILLILVVLMQRPKNEGLGAAFGSGVTENIFGAQTATVLTKATVYLGCIFFAVTLLLTLLTARQSAARRVGLLEGEVRKAAPAVSPSALAPSPGTTVASPRATVSAIPSGSPQASVSAPSKPAPSPAASVNTPPAAGNENPSGSPSSNPH